MIIASYYDMSVIDKHVIQVILKRGEGGIVYQCKMSREKVYEPKNPNVRRSIWPAQGL